MAIDIVTTTASSGDGSLAATLAAATAGDTIEFAAGLAGDTIDLASTLTINQNITIEGRTDGENITLHGTASFTDISIGEGVAADLDGLDITGGAGQGTNGSGQTFNGAYLVASAGGNAAGGIYDAGTLTLTNSRLSSDIAIGGTGGSGAGDYVGGGAGGAAAGGIYVRSNATLNVNTANDRFIGDNAQGGSGASGSQSFLDKGFPGGAGGAGGYQYSGGRQFAPGPGDAGVGPHGGAGGAAGQNGQYGQTYGAYSGPGGGGGGGWAFADYGGRGQVNIACFRRGTRLLTPSGEIAVEALHEGDVVTTVLGEGSATVRWIGHRRIDCDRHPNPAAVWPVCITADAFAPGQPRRDLWLSPDHAVYLAGHGGALVPVRYLINGASIVQQEVPEVIYFHVELDRHDVVFADGLPAESYLDTGNRGNFTNGGEPIRAHADFSRAIWQVEGCARLLVDGPHLIAARQHLLDRAATLGWTRSPDPTLRVAAAGRTLAVTQDGDWLRLVLPAGAAAARLLSRHMVPAQMFAGSSDTRPLGLAVTGVELDGVALALDDPRLAAGWHTSEPGLRWTDGAAVLHCAGAAILRLQVAELPQFWLPPELDSSQLELISRAA